MKTGHKNILVQFLVNKEILDSSAMSIVLVTHMGLQMRELEIRQQAELEKLRLEQELQQKRQLQKERMEMEERVQKERMEMEKRERKRKTKSDRNGKVKICRINNERIRIAKQDSKTATFRLWHSF